VFKTNDGEIYEGVWQLDKASNMSVFRQKDVIPNKNGRSVEVWSDGSYYLG
jgi:hypothetical protein